MKTRATLSSVSAPTDLFGIIATEFPEFLVYRSICVEFFRLKTYDRDFCIRTLRIARDASVSWQVRCLAILMLEHQTLKIDSDNLVEFDFLLHQLNLIETSSGRIVTSVLREGYSSTDLRQFVDELRARLARLNRVHERLRGVRTSRSALQEFFRTSQDTCKLSLGRYLLAPDEVVVEILKQLRVTEGVRDLDVHQPRYIADEIKRTLNLLPEYEARILERLCETANVYWVSETTTARINSLVEYPLTTVVIVIKPPGSNFEFEIKRAGLRGRNSLDVVFARRGFTVAPSHRLSGGSMQWLLRYETNHATKLSRIYRLVHGGEAPMPAYISRSTISSVPVPNDEVQTLTYFTDPEAFGPSFPKMRAAMKQSVTAFRKEGYVNLPTLPSELGLSAQFVGTVTPCQAILCGTTSFRLDKLDKYLSVAGADDYFKRGMHVPSSRPDRKHFIDSILEEILGTYLAPRVGYRSHNQYVAAAFAIPENRKRADEVYLSLTVQIAKFWGTLLGVRGYSRGESFVARNVGLRSIWEQGQWNVKIIFMDHDALVIPNSENGAFFARGDLHNMRLDERYIWERSDPRRFAESQVGRLQRIYRISQTLDTQGQVLARAALKDAYKQTQHALLTNPELQRLFSKGVREKLLDWDALVDGYLRLNGNQSVAATWKNKMRGMFAAKGYREDVFDAYVEAIEKNRAFLERHSYLFEAATKTFAAGRRLP